MQRAPTIPPLTIKQVVDALLFEYRKFGNTGVFRNYYGKKQVVEMALEPADPWTQEFWGLWRGQKVALKALGIGVFRLTAGGNEAWILFWEVPRLRQYLEKSKERVQ